MTKPTLAQATHPTNSLENAHVRARVVPARVVAISSHLGGFGSATAQVVPGGYVAAPRG
jgi:hypothetical protein